MSTPEPGTSRHEVSDLLARLIAQAEQGFADACAGVSACAISRSGRPVPAMKYHEGRWAALREVARQGGRGRGGAVPDVVDACRTAWTAALARAVARDAGPNWVAYREGGLSALETLTEQLG